MRRSFLVLGAAGLLGGCSVARRVRGYKTYTEQLGLRNVGPAEMDASAPALGARVTAAGGEPVITQGREMRVVAINVLAPYIAHGEWDTDGLKYTITVPAGLRHRIAVDASGADHFGFPAGATVRWLYDKPREDLIRGNIRRATDGSFTVLWTYPDEQFEWREIPAPGLQAVATTAVVGVSANSFRRELVYTGRAGNSLSLMYREFVNDMARPAFSQSLQYDISSDPVIGYQGARFRVISADNTGITYEVLAPLAPR